MCPAPAQAAQSSTQRPIAPGTYLRTRRAAAGLSLHDVAARISTDPRLAETDRIAWLRMIENGDAPVTADVARALGRAFAFDPVVLGDLIDIALTGAQAPPPRLCRLCACSENDPCWDAAAQSACAWAATDLCTACAALAPAPNQENGHA